MTTAAAMTQGEGGVGGGGGGGSAGTNHSRQPATAAAMAQRGSGGGGSGLAGANHIRQQETARAAAAMALMRGRGSGGAGSGGLVGMNFNLQQAFPTALAHRGVGAGVSAAGMDHNRRQQLLASYYRDLSLVAALPPAAAVADNAGSLSDIEDPPVDVPTANNPSRVAAAAAAPPLMDALGASLGMRWFDLAARDARRRRAEPSEDDNDEGSSRRRRQRQAEDEASSEVGAASPEEIYEVLKEIPDLGRADLLRAYSKLIRDARQFRCLMALPNDMRKDWLLMEIGNQ